MLHTLDLTAKTIVGMVEEFFKQLPNMFLGAFIVFVFIKMSKYVQRLIVVLGSRAKLDLTLSRALGNISSVAVTVLGVLVAATVVFPSFKAAHLVAGLGITSVAIGFAFKDMLQNFFAGLLLLWQKPFKIGDHIRSRDYEGIVDGIEIHSTKLMTPNGQLVVLPNGDVFTNPIVVNTAYERFRSHLTVSGPAQLGLNEARKKILSTVAGVEGVFPDPPPRVYVTNVDDGPPKFDVYFWTKPHEAEVLESVDRVATALRNLIGATVEQKSQTQAPAQAGEAPQNEDHIREAPRNEGVAAPENRGGAQAA